MSLPSGDAAARARYRVPVAVSLFPSLPNSPKVCQSTTS